MKLDSDGEEDGASEEWSTEYNDVVVNADSGKSNNGKLSEGEATLKPLPDVVPDTLWAGGVICWVDYFSSSFVKSACADVVGWKQFVQMLPGENSFCWSNNDNIKNNDLATKYCFCVSCT